MNKRVCGVTGLWYICYRELKGVAQELVGREEMASFCKSSTEEGHLALAQNPQWPGTVCGLSVREQLSCPGRRWEH